MALVHPLPSTATTTCAQHRAYRAGATPPRRRGSVAAASTRCAALLLVGLVGLGCGCDDTGPSSSTGTTARGATVGFDGTWACLEGVMSGPSMIYQPSTLPAFTIRDGAYLLERGEGGRAAVNGEVLALDGGTFDGWRGLIKPRGGGHYIAFSKRALLDAEAARTLKVGDYQCHLQR